MRCGIKHQIPEITCVRPQGHGGFCWSKWARFPGGVIQRTEWQSRDGLFWRHHTYRAFYPENGNKEKLHT